MIKKIYYLYAFSSIYIFSLTLYGMESATKKSRKREQAPVCTLLETSATQVQVKKVAPDLPPLRLTRILSQAEDALSNPQITEFIEARQGTEKIGRIFFTYSPDSRQGYIEDLDVEKNYRRHGYGKQLMQAALQDLQEWGCKEANLCAKPDKKKYFSKLVAFYEQFGFHADDDDSGMDNAIIMGKKFE